ncbi:MAG: hypothetical protein NVSMB66_6350 [Candidatus Doudnabacteria bacterium]
MTNNKKRASVGEWIAGISFCITIIIGLIGIGWSWGFLDGSQSRDEFKKYSVPYVSIPIDEKPYETILIPKKLPTDLCFTGGKLEWEDCLPQRVTLQEAVQLLIDTEGYKYQPQSSIPAKLIK